MFCGDSPRDFFFKKNIIGYNGIHEMWYSQQTLGIPFGNQTWLAGKEYLNGKLMKLEGGFSSKTYLIFRGKGFSRGNYHWLQLGGNSGTLHSGDSWRTSRCELVSPVDCSFPGQVPRGTTSPAVHPKGWRSAGQGLFGSQKSTRVDVSNLWILMDFCGCSWIFVSFHQSPQ